MHRIIIRYKHVKAIAVISFFCLFFLIDFSSGFSLKDKSANSGFSNSVYPRSYTLTNDKSELESYNRLDQSFNSFIKKWDLAGASVAIAKDGKLLYAKGFGYADKEDSIKAEPFSMYRIASVSKLITAVGVMKLIEGKRLNLNTKIFGENGLLNDTCYSHYVDKRVEDITVKNLLNHSAGWTSYWGDHMFINDMIAKSLKKPLPINLQDIITFALSKKLHFQPGTYSSYCNLGFSVLQLVVEKASGQSYESYIKENVFYPLNIEDANLSFNFDSLRYPNEARYYEIPEAQKVIAFDGSKDSILKCRGGNDIRTLGAAGGWVISSVSLLKLLLAIDGNDNFPDLLTRKSISRLIEREGEYQPLGWKTIYPNGKWWRSGSFPGTSALAVVRSDGFTYVFLTNTSPWSGSKFPYEIDRLMSRNLRMIENWPNVNLFYPSQPVN
ncbi:MAG: class A beta-lactamase-related serine hydrolase [Bacteroidales bacterium]|nr:MAG: class A beta-lactamase-related serine hydrolase [Bacteroidales bacterium]